MAKNRPSIADNEQKHLPGTAPKKNTRIHPKAVRYFDLMQARIAAGKEEKDAKTTLTEAMIEDGLDHYEYGGIRVDIDTKRNVKVKVDGKDETGEGADAE